MPADKPFGYTFDQADRLSCIRLMTVDQLRQVIAMPEGDAQSGIAPLQKRVRSAARAQLRKLEKAATGSEQNGALSRAPVRAAPTRDATGKTIRVNEKQRAMLENFAKGLEQHNYFFGASRRCAQYLVNRGLLVQVAYHPTNEGWTLYDITDAGRQFAGGEE